jgi:micrococcal nuclease
MFLRGRNLLMTALLAQGAFLFGSGMEHEFYGRVVSVYAGDQFEVMHRGRHEHIRLYGVHCPQGVLGEQARRFTETLAASRGVHVRLLGSDHRGSRFAYVSFLGGRNLSYELVRAGFAKWDSKLAPGDEQLASLEQEARETHRGMWSQNPVMAQKLSSLRH